MTPEPNKPSAYSGANYQSALANWVNLLTSNGMVVILDPRVLTKGYGRTFLSALPECRRFVDGQPEESALSGGQPR